MMISTLYFKLMSFLPKIRKVLCHFDLFCSSQFLRYNEQKKYKTLTGGLLSLGLIIVIIVAFASMIMNTINETTITSNFAIVKHPDPPLAYLTPNQQNNFMMAFSIDSADSTYNANLSATPKYFDLQMQIVETVNGAPTYIGVSLQTCTKQHWTMIPSVYDGFDQLGGSGWLCFPLNYKFPIQGGSSSRVRSQTIIKLYPCSNSTSYNGCASQTNIDDLFSSYHNFYLKLAYVNPMINANQQDFMDYYLQSDDYMIFSKEMGSQTNLYFSDYTINSDYSILPYYDIVTTSGCIVESKPINHPLSNEALATVFLSKSPNSLVYTRGVQKVSSVCSYMGGFIGFVTALLFLVKIYTDSSLEITIGLNLFSEKETEERIQQFNFLGFLRLTAYRMLRMFKWEGQWKIPEQLERYQDEAIKQLDIHILLKRVIMLETCIDRLLPKEELDRIKQEEKDNFTIKRVQRMRSLLIKQKTSCNIEQMPQDLDKIKETKQNFIEQPQQISWYNIPREKQQTFSRKKQQASNNDDLEVQKESQILSKLNNDLYLICTHKQQKQLHEKNRVKSLKIIKSAKILKEITKKQRGGRQQRKSIFKNIQVQDTIQDL